MILIKKLVLVFSAIKYSIEFYKIKITKSIKQVLNQPAYDTFLSMIT